MTTAHIALGSNLGDREATLRSAIDRLGNSPGVHVVRVSSFLQNAAVGGPADSPQFLNAVAEVETSLDARQLLERLLAVERSLGRERREKWGPRTIDLDLILFGDEVIDEPDLKVPHPLMHERDFVLTPLTEIAPAVVHPVLERTAGELARAFETASRDTGFQPVLATPDSHNSESTVPNGRAPNARVGNPCHGTRAPTYQLRPATNADGNAVRGLVFSVLREYGLQPDPCRTDLDLFDLERWYADAGGRFDVLVDSAGVVVGTVGLARVNADTCELRKMYLQCSARGQGQGRRLLDHAIVEARRMGFRRLTLETAGVLKEAVALYERYGFKPCAIDPAHKVPRCDAAYELDLSTTCLKEPCTERYSAE